MRFYVLIVLVSLVLIPVAYRRSGSMTRYVTFTGAPIVWVLLGAAAAVALAVELAGDPGLAQRVFTGGLLGTAFVQIILLRRGLSEVGDAVDANAGRRSRGDDLGGD